MTTTQTPYPSDADCFFGTTSVPAPPETAPGRRLYLDDAVTEAIGELRRRLRSSREEMVTQALFAILDLEKHKLRHGRPISGTHVPYLGDLDEERAIPLPPLPAPPWEGEAPAEPSFAIPDCFDDAKRDLWGDVPIAQVSTPIKIDREAGIAPPNTPPPSPDELPSSLTLQSRAEPPKLHGPILENQATGTATPLGDPAFAAQLERDRAAYIAWGGTYPEDDFPDCPLLDRFKSEPRPHPAELRWRQTSHGPNYPPNTS